MPARHRTLLGYALPLSVCAASIHRMSNLIDGELARKQVVYPEQYDVLVAEIDVLHAKLMLMRNTIVSRLDTMFAKKSNGHPA